MKPKTNYRIMDLRGTYKGGGGPDKTILLTATKHDEKYFFVLVTYLRDPLDSEFQIAEKASRLNINYIDVPDRSLLDWKCIYLLNGLIRKHSLDLIHAHDDKSSLYSFLLKMLNPRIKVIYTCHLYTRYVRSDFRSTQAYLSDRLRQFIRFFLILCSGKPIIAVSDAVKKTLNIEGLPLKLIKTLHNGIDINTWQKKNGKAVLRGKFCKTKDTQIVGTVARIAYQKDFSTFFRVADKVKSVLPNVEFVIVGDGNGNELEDTKELALNMGVSDFVHFTGHRNDLLDVYRSFDLFLMTSVAEGLPNTILEAMAMELPVVATSVDGVPEVVIDGETGFLCPVKDVDCLSDKLIWLLKNEKVNKQFGIKGRNRILESFDFDKRVKAMESIYKAAISGNS